MDEQTTAVDYPTVTIAGKVYRIRFRAGDIRRLKAEGIDLMGAQQTLQGAEALKNTLTLFKHGVAWEHPTLKIEDIEDDIDLSDIPVISFACQEAQLKASAQASKMTGPALLRFKAYSDQIMASIPKEMLDKIEEAKKLAESTDKPN